MALPTGGRAPRMTMRPKLLLIVVLSLAALWLVLLGSVRHRSENSTAPAAEDGLLAQSSAVASQAMKREPAAVQQHVEPAPSPKDTAVPAAYVAETHPQVGNLNADPQAQ